MQGSERSAENPFFDQGIKAYAVSCEQVASGYKKTTRQWTRRVVEFRWVVRGGEPGDRGPRGLVERINAC